MPKFSHIWLRWLWIRQSCITVNYNWCRNSPKLWRNKIFKLIKGKNATTSFLPLPKKGNWLDNNKDVRYIPDKEQKCLMEDQARHVYKKVEMDKIINIESVKHEIEDDKMTRNKLNEDDTTEANLYQMVILNKVYKDDIKTEQIIHWSILSDLIKYIDGSLDMAPSLTVKPLDYRQHKRFV